MTIRDTADRAEDYEQDEPDAELGETDILPLELTVRESGSMTEFSAPMGEGVKDSLRWVMIDSEYVVSLEDMR